MRRKLKHRFLAWSRKTEKLADRFATAERINMVLQDEVNRLRKAVAFENARYVKAQDRLQLFEAGTQAEVMTQIDLRVMELSGDKPILVVSAPKRMLETGAFAQLNWKLKRLCPRIKVVFFVEEGVCSLAELDEHDLNAMGLARIVGTSEKALPEGQLAIEGKT